MVQLSATRCSCIAILWLSLRSFGAITLCVASQRVIPKVRVYFVIDSVRKLLDTPSYLVSAFQTSYQSSYFVTGHTTLISVSLVWFLDYHTRSSLYFPFRHNTVIPVFLLSIQANHTRYNLFTFISASSHRFHSLYSHFRYTTSVPISPLSLLA
jgi:hypothetical protein